VDLRDSPDEAAFRAKLRDWLAANLPAEPGREWSRKLYDAGYVGLTWPEEYGGHSAPYSHQAIVLEELARAQAPQHVGVIGLGSWFGCERFGVRPDMLTFAKGVTSGYQPLGGVLVSGRVAEPFWSEPGRIMIRHGQTYAGHASVCAAGLANLAILEREGLIPRGQELEGELYGALAPLAEHPLVGEIRGGVGLMAAVELAGDLLEADHGAATRLYRGVRSHGVLTRAHARGLAISPPLIVTIEQIQEIADAVRAALDDLAAVDAAA
jgi:adenosylmethionine-8-amino-7-oxononanoate aminotransferase